MVSCQRQAVSLKYMYNSINEFMKILALVNKNLQLCLNGGRVSFCKVSST